MKLTPKVERFCREMVKPKATQYKAYKAAFNATKMKRATIDNEAYKLMKDPKITARIAELSRPAIQKVMMSREEWLLEMEKIMRGDVRKLFTGPGDAKEIAELGDNEAALIEGFELVENFEKVGDKAEHVGYTKKYKLTPKLKRALEFGKVMGWYTEKKEIGLDATLEELVMGSMKE